MSTRRSPRQTPALPLANPWLTVALAWAVPGGGHVYLGRRGRGAFFFVLIGATLALGCSIGGHLPWQFGGSPLLALASIGALGTGALVLFVHYALGYAADVTGPGFEYGRAFIITAGLMNWMLVLDAWDILWGKELEDAESGEEDAGAPA